VLKGLLVEPFVQDNLHVGAQVQQDLEWMV
jgi:hypothetical protein